MNSLPQRLDYARKQLQRRINLLLGRPATPAAATLSRMLNSIRSEIESRLSTSIATVGIASANGVELSVDRVNDALDYIGFRKLDQWQVPHQELNAACEEVENAFGAGDVVLRVDYTTKTLAANTAWISTAGATYATREILDWELGRDEASRQVKESTYWADVGRRIREVVVAARRPYTQLLLTGERAEDERLLEVVQNALWGFVLANKFQAGKTQVDSTFGVARGAADFQRKRQQGWLGCVQPQYCEGSSSMGVRTAEKVLEL